MKEGRPRQPTVGGELLHALDTALTAAWENDPLIEALVHDERLVEAVADLEFAVEVLRSALAGSERGDARGKPLVPRHKESDQR
jgi:hypothetical protein